MGKLHVKLAGFNVDRGSLQDAIDKITEGSPNGAINILNNLTPETISAAYARISRDPSNLADLRKIAREQVDASRKTNEAIIFTMGHKSIAEHAFLNFDIEHLSRKAVETVEKKRLMSFTEKSQRYITLDGDYVVPNELKGTPEEKLFIENIEKQNQFYNTNLEKLKNWHFNQDYSELFKSLNCKSLEKQKVTTEGLGKEDARYPLAMATEAQLGISVSARNLESLITMLQSSELEELKELGEKLFTEVDGIAPSVIKYTKPTLYFQQTRKDLETFASQITAGKLFKADSLSNVQLFEKLSRDDSILAGLLFSSSNMNYATCLNVVQNMDRYEKGLLVELSQKYQEVHDPKLREFELGDRVAEFKMSSSAFAQMKRHRMNTLIPQKYNPMLGYTTPKSIICTGLKDEFENILNQSTNTYYHLLKQGYSSDVAEYVLTNAHKRRVLLDANNRQIVAICAERKNLPAQWDIRELIDEYSKLVQKSCPLTLKFLPGKDKFYDFKKVWSGEE